MKIANVAVSTVPATASPASGFGAQVPDDRGVDEHVERLGRERAERGEREPDDLAIVRAAAGREHPGDASDRSRGRRRDSASVSVRGRRVRRAPRTRAASRTAQARWSLLKKTNPSALAAHRSASRSIQPTSARSP